MGRAKWEWTIPEPNFKRQLAVVQKGHCFYCNGKIRYADDATLDHLIPVSQGGPTELWNLVLACRKCNERKDNRMPTDAEMDRRLAMQVS